MKKLTYTLFAFAMVGMVACGEKKEEGEGKEGEKTEQSSETSEAAPEVAMSEVDFSESGYAFAMQAPEGTKLVEGEWDTEISNDDKSFAMTISENDGSAFDQTIEKTKEFWGKNDVNKLQSYVHETENGFIAETEVMGESQHHLFYIANVGDKEYVFENFKGRSFSKAEAMNMFKALESIQGK